RDAFYEDYPDSKMNIQVVDSVSYSVGYGWPIMQADKMIDDGISPDALITFLKNQFDKTEILLSAYSLKFMKKSGRISAAAAFAGEVMGLKPIITMRHGQTKVIAKVRGDKMVIPALIRMFKERAVDTENYVIGYTDEEYGKELYSTCVKELGNPPLLSIELGSAVATNAGNHSIGILYYTGE
ncbi:MAG: DegV family EDD domain-containing protein, partial [Oscillospiraceae bacterium]|nr:DegV family EDD domain-containing protein [Oscillospiraceae bacterium]